MSVEYTEAMFLAAAIERGYWLTGDNRVGEADAAELLGYSADYLAERRREGAGPKSFRSGGGGHRVSYRIRDLAEWIESLRAD